MCYGQYMDEEGHENAREDDAGDDLVIHDDLPAAAEERDDLDGIRIRQITKMKRSAVRSRGYMLVGAVFCFGLALQLIWYAAGSFRAGARMIGVAYVAGAMGLLMVSWIAVTRAAKFKREADAKLLEEPKTPPDFSKLSDGSQAWKNLEDVE